MVVDSAARDAGRVAGAVDAGPPAPLRSAQDRSRHSL